MANFKNKHGFKVIAVLIVLILAFALSGYIKNTQKTTAKSNASKATPSKVVKKDNKNPIVTIEMKDGSKIKIELYPKIAPNTVRNFISLIKKKFYDGLIFHRVIPGFMIQGGDPEGTGMGGPGYSIKGEFKNNKFPNSLKHERGVISMARNGDQDPSLDSAYYNTAGSQFFIVVADSEYLDGNYASFGKVIEGMNVVDKIVNVEQTDGNRPVVDQKMKKVTVDTFGINYGEVIKIKK